LNETLDLRLRHLHARQRARAWGYRQRHCAKGVWWRLRRLLAEAERAAVVDADTAAALLADGFGAERVGQEVEPPKTLIFVPRDRFDRLAGRREIAVTLSAELLAARNLVLVAFDA